MPTTVLEAMETQELVPLRNDGRVWGFQCKAIRACGLRCRKYAIRGGYVCRTHGANLPAVRAAARARFLALTHPAIAALADIIENGKPADQLRAAKFVLRYAGITPANIRKTEVANRTLDKGAPPLAIEAPDAEIEGLLDALRLD